MVLAAEVLEKEKFKIILGTESYRLFQEEIGRRFEIVFRVILKRIRFKRNKTLGISGRIQITLGVIRRKILAKQTRDEQIQRGLCIWNKKSY